MLCKTKSSFLYVYLTVHKIWDILYLKLKNMRTLGGKRIFLYFF